LIDAKVHALPKSPMEEERDQPRTILIPQVNERSISQRRRFDGYQASMKDRPRPPSGEASKEGVNGSQSPAVTELDCVPVDLQSNREGFDGSDGWRLSGSMVQIDRDYLLWRSEGEQARLWCLEAHLAAHTWDRAHRWVGPTSKSGADKSTPHLSRAGSKSRISRVEGASVLTASPGFCKRDTPGTRLPTAALRSQRSWPCPRQFIREPGTAVCCRLPSATSGEIPLVIGPPRTQRHSPLASRRRQVGKEDGFL